MTDYDLKSFFRLLARVDYVSLLIMVSLLSFGVVFIYGTGVEIGGDFAGKWSRQLAWIALGGVLYVAAAVFDYRKLGNLNWGAYLFALVLLVLLFPLGRTINSSRSWLLLPGIGYLQPSEIAKPLCLLFLSWLGSHAGLRDSFLPLPLVIAAGSLPPFLLICLQPDYGTALVFIPFTLAIIFITGLSWRWLLLGVALGLLAVPAVYPLLKPHQQERVKVFLEGPAQGALAVVSPLLSDGSKAEWSVRLDGFFLSHRGRVRDNWNARQSLLAVGSGGLTGKGFMRGTQHVLGYLPKTVAPTDFIFSVIAEETGFAGSLLLLLLLSGLIARFCYTALQASHPMGACLALGAAVILATHTLINIGMTIQAAPIIGIPLPFVSYGGSFMLGTMFMAGLVQNVHLHRGQDERQEMYD